MKTKPADYNKLFRLKGKMTLLNAEFISSGSLRLGEPLITYRGSVFDSFIHREKEKKCLRKGLKLFSSREKYIKYAKDFRQHISHIMGELREKYRTVPKQFTKSEFANLVRDCRKFWYYYGFTEWSYHDLAYEKMIETNDSVLRANLKDLEKLKFKGRETLNALIFKKGILQNILRCVSKKYLDKEDDAFYLDSSEILRLLGGKKLSKKLVQDRRKCYTVTYMNRKFVTFPLKESLKLNKIFTHVKDTDTITGIIANKGKAKGKVVIAPMLTDMKDVKTVTKRMKKGDVLVAESTTPELTPLCNKAAAIVTDQGGMLSHAAIISRELNIPCIIATNIATQVLKDGDSVEVDADNGIIKKISENKQQNI